MNRPVSMKDINITDPFFAGRIKMAREIAIPYMWDALNDRIPDIPKSHCIANFRIAAGLEQGRFEGFVFQDSDLYKWLEGVAFSLMTHPDAALEAQADAAIELVGRAQLSDGYIDTYFIINGIEKRWTDERGAHETYVAGHMMEAATAYYDATGKAALLNIACRFADHIDGVYGREPGKKRGYPGHQEIEIGLVKLYRTTGEKRYLRLAQYFIEERGTQPYYFDIEAKARGEKDDGMKSFFRTHGEQPYSYQQAHKPVFEQTEAVGHAVRLGYMTAAMADVAALTGSGRMMNATRTLFDDVVNRQMYITGGVGSMGDGEAFTFDYDLPNDRMYTETCASIALLMTAQRLLNADNNSYYADACERTLYNGILSGVSLDGRKYFYMNPLEVWPERCKRRHDMDVDSERQGWFGCACCPPNVLRTLTGLGQYIYSQGESGIYVHQYIASEAVLDINGSAATLVQKGCFPWEGRIEFALKAEEPLETALYLRVPGWCRSFELTINGEDICTEDIMENGYIALRRTFRADDVIVLDMAMPAERVYCSDNVPFNAGRVALMRGPLVYCLEQQDNGDHLWNIKLAQGDVECRFESELLGGVETLAADGVREISRGSALYARDARVEVPVKLKFVPYYAWCNRKPGEMEVWVRDVRS